MPTTQAMTDSWSIQSTTGQRDGRLFAGTFLTPASGMAGPMVGWRSGVVASTDVGGGPCTDLRVIQQSPSSREVRIYPGVCIINRSGQGPYVCQLSSTGTLESTSADATNPRIDLVVARLYDSAIGDTPPGGGSGAYLEIIAGTPAASPTVPSTPTGAIPLAQVNRPAGDDTIVDADITDLRKGAGIRNAPWVLLPGDSLSEAGAYTGEQRFVGRKDSSNIFPYQWWDGAAWRGQGAGATYQTTTISTLTGQTGAASLASVSFSDPGVPYKVIATGSAELSSPDSGTRVDLSCRLDTATGTLISLGIGPQGTGSWTNTDTRVSSTLSATGTKTVHLAGARIFGSGAWSSTSFNGSLSVRVIPA